MAPAINNIPGIELFIVETSNTTNLANKWKIWKDDFSKFVTASGVAKDDQKKALFVHIGGKDIKEIYRSLSSDIHETFEPMGAKLDTYFIPKKTLKLFNYLTRIQSLI